MDSSNGGSGVEGSAFVSLFTLLLTQYYEHLLLLHPWKRLQKYHKAWKPSVESCTWKIPQT